MPFTLFLFLQVGFCEPGLSLILPLSSSSRPCPPLSPLGVVARTPSARRCTPPPLLRALAHPCMRRRRIVRARVWGEGEGMCSRNRAVLQVHRDTFAVLRCTHNIVRCTRTLNRKGTVFSGTGRGMTHGTRGLPMSCPMRGAAATGARSVVVVVRA
jgi:hypothetical protein